MNWISWNGVYGENRTYGVKFPHSYR